MEKNNPDEKIDKKCVHLSLHSNLSTCLLFSCLTNISSLHLLFFFHFFRTLSHADRDTARLIIRKIQYAPAEVGAGPKAEICKSFMMSDKPVHLEASMEKDVWLQNSTVICLKIQIDDVSIPPPLTGCFVVLTTALLPWWIHPNKNQNQQREQQNSQENQNHRWVLMLIEIFYYIYCPLCLTFSFFLLYSSSHSGPNHRHRPLFSRQIHQDCPLQRVWVRTTSKLEAHTLVYVICNWFVFCHP